MSLLPLSAPMVAGQFARQKALNEEQGNLFDLLLATAAAHLQQAPLPSGGELEFAGDQAVNGPPAQPPNQSVVPQMAADASLATTPHVQAAPHAHEVDAMPRPHIKADDATYFVQHGTLPVMIAGQLVELTLLRERRPSREAAPTRRLSMTLEAPLSGSVKVGARVEGESLLISFESAVTPEAATRESHAREVAALARRLGWTFTDTRWEDAE